MNVKELHIKVTQLIEKAEPLEPPKDFDKMRTLVNDYINHGWRFVYWCPDGYVLMRTTCRHTDMLRVYETGLVEKADRVTGEYKKIE